MATVSAIDASHAKAMRSLDTPARRSIFAAFFRASALAGEPLHLLREVGLGVGALLNGAVDPFKVPVVVREAFREFAGCGTPVVCLLLRLGHGVCVQRSFTISGNVIVTTR